MKKKTAVRDKGSSSKLNKNQEVVPHKATVLEMKNKPIPHLTFKDDPHFAQAVQNYEAGVKAVQEHKFEKAKALLDRVMAGASRELADRAKLHLNICNQQLAKTSTSFKTPEEHYDYAVSLMNRGDYDGARLHLEKIIKQLPKADYAFYGMAVIDCLTGNAEACLQRLSAAISYNPALRFQARNDSDFQKMGDDPRFTELLYPEISDSASGGSAEQRSRR